MLYKFTEIKKYYIEAETEEEALDKYSELHEGEVFVELIPPEEVK